MSTRSASSASRAALFEPFVINGLALRNRIVMSSMGRAHAPDGILHASYPDYFRRRAENEVGLIMTEATAISHPAAAFADNGPHLFGDQALAEWAKVVPEVHRAGGKIVPQLWHAGMQRMPGTKPVDVKPIGPSGVLYPFPGQKDTPAVGAVAGPPMTQADIDAVVDSFAEAVATAQRLGFDGAEIHGGHGFLVDQFLWQATNRRTDEYGGSFRNRARFAAEIVQESRRRVGPDFPILFRLSQFKLTDYTARMVTTPAELEELLAPLVDAGVDIFDCSQRRFWKSEFPDSDLNLAGWTKRLSGKPTITCGSVGLDIELWEGSLSQSTWEDGHPSVAHLERLGEMLVRGDFDLVAVGRSLLADPGWSVKIREGRFDDLVPFSIEVLGGLV